MTVQEYFKSRPLGGPDYVEIEGWPDWLIVRHDKGLTVCCPNSSESELSCRDDSELDLWELMLPFAREYGRIWYEVSVAESEPAGPWYIEGPCEMEIEDVREAALKNDLPSDCREVTEEEWRRNEARPPQEQMRIHP